MSDDDLHAAADRRRDAAVVRLSRELNGILTRALVEQGRRPLDPDECPVTDVCDFDLAIRVADGDAHARDEATVRGLIDYRRVEKRDGSAAAWLIREKCPAFMAVVSHYTEARRYEEAVASKRDAVHHWRPLGFDAPPHAEAVTA